MDISGLIQLEDWVVLDSSFTESWRGMHITNIHLDGVRGGFGDRTARPITWRYVDKPLIDFTAIREVWRNVVVKKEFSFSVGDRTITVRESVKEWHRIDACGILNHLNEQGD